MINKKVLSILLLTVGGLQAANQDASYRENVKAFLKSKGIKECRKVGGRRVVTKWHPREQSSGNLARTFVSYGLLGDLSGSNKQQETVEETAEEAKHLERIAFEVAKKRKKKNNSKRLSDNGYAPGVIKTNWKQGNRGNSGLTNRKIQELNKDRNKQVS